MAWQVTKLVLRAHLPVTIPNRPAAKLVLLVLADLCTKTGHEAWPSVATISAAAEMCERAVQGHLSALRKHGLIAEQRPSSQHLSRTWRLDLAALSALGAEVQPTAPLNDVPEVQFAAPLSEASGEQPAASAVQPPEPGVQIDAPDVQRVAPDPILRSDPLDPIDPRTAAAPRFSELAKMPNGDNYRPILAVVNDLLNDQPDLAREFGNCVEAAKQRCADLGIDYGRADGVSFNVVHRACASAIGARIAARKGLSDRPPRRGAR